MKHDTFAMEFVKAIVDMLTETIWPVFFGFRSQNQKEIWKNVSAGFVPVVRECGREHFAVEKVTRWTYICSKHFVGENGPTTEHPDLIPATHTPHQEQIGAVCVCYKNGGGRFIKYNFKLRTHNG